MDGDVFHSVDEFGNFPWDKINLSTFNAGQWGLARGGHGLPDYVYTIKIFRGLPAPLDIAQDIWALPEGLGTLFGLMKKEGREQAIRRIKDSLEI